MKTAENISAHKSKIVKIDPSLEKYRNKTPFPKKLEEVNEMLKIAKLPKRK